MNTQSPLLSMETVDCTINCAHHGHWTWTPPPLPEWIPQGARFIISFPWCLLFDNCFGFHDMKRNDNIKIPSLFSFIGIAENQKSLSSKFYKGIKYIPAGIYCQPQWTTGNLKCLLSARRRCIEKQLCGKSVWNTLFSESPCCQFTNAFTPWRATGLLYFYTCLYTLKTAFL